MRSWEGVLVLVCRDLFEAKVIGEIVLRREVACSKMVSVCKLQPYEIRSWLRLLFLPTLQTTFLLKKDLLNSSDPDGFHSFIYLRLCCADGVFWVLTLVLRWWKPAINMQVAVRPRVGWEVDGSGRGW